jgi:hypothetical protein
MRKRKKIWEWETERTRVHVRSWITMDFRVLDPTLFLSLLLLNLVEKNCFSQCGSRTVYFISLPFPFACFEIGSYNGKFDVDIFCMSVSFFVRLKGKSIFGRFLYVKKVHNCQIEWLKILWKHRKKWNINQTSITTTRLDRNTLVFSLAGNVESSLSGHVSEFTHTKCEEESAFWWCFFGWIILDRKWSKLAQVNRKERAWVEAISIEVKHISTRVLSI